MSYRNNRFDNSMHSLELAAEGKDMAKWSVLSDCGLGVARMMDEIDGEMCAGDRRTTGKPSCACPHAQTTEPPDEAREDKLFEAEMRLADAGKSHLIRVLLLIVENGPRREDSINALTAFSKNWNAARKKYFEHRDRLIDFFKSDSSAHGYIEGRDGGAVPPRCPLQTKGNKNHETHERPDQRKARGPLQGAA